jgi:hypothetical protein
LGAEGGEEWKGAMSEIQRYIAKVQEIPKDHHTYIADEIVVRNAEHERIVAKLKAQVARLSAPVSDEEWQRYIEDIDHDDHKQAVNVLLVSRWEPPSPVQEASHSEDGSSTVEKGE